MNSPHPPFTTRREQAVCIQQGSPTQVRVECSFAATRQVDTTTVDPRFEPSENPKGELRRRNEPGLHRLNASNTRISEPRPGAEQPQLSADGASVERLRRVIRPMPRFPIAVGAALVAIAFAATAGRAAPTPTPGGALGATSSSAAAEYSAAVTQICDGARLFEGVHELSSRSDALEIAQDIQASTARRLTQVTALAIPPELNRISSRWISSQQSLASLYARTWVDIFDAVDTIDAARTSAQRTTLAKRIEELVHAPDSLKQAAERLERELHVPDCTGGG